MYGRSVSTPCVQPRQNTDGSGGRWSKTVDEVFDAFDTTGRRHGPEKDDTKPLRRTTFSLSALGKRITSSFSFPKSQDPHNFNSNEARRTIYRRTATSASRDGLWRGSDSSIKIGEHLDSVNSKCISATTSFKGTRLQGLSYVASFTHEYERSSYKGFSLDQAAKVVSSSTISSKDGSPISIGCDSPCDVFASFSDGSEDSGTPWFDPDLLNVFERALEQIPGPFDNRTSTDEIALSESTQSCFRQKVSCERSNDSLEMKGGGVRRNKLSVGNSEGFLGSFREKKEMNVAKKILEGLRGNSRAKKDVSSLKKLVSLVSTEFHKDNSNANLLERFPLLCPPGGEHKVVLFFTSLRGVRTTFENCHSIRMTLSGFRVKMDERDVSMHSDFKRELKDLLGKSVSLPRLFIKGRYVGGVEEVMLLNEDGVLRKLLEDVPRTAVGACDRCADVRFIPCSKCSGSCKIISHENKVVRCPRCNENGLERCTICC
ncbi:hypothetical protein O6H91_01G001200 [Diphasiastrum complanatum]|uniref:Uncharacterized protein n=1 Tax=Diphasiastrum complanatum TaxID=34168 RepID=A0ACC2EMG1_DIPCM|nr:hypothetical protein O6H91_01G001200 [Diphasiastrum complanatum]